MREIKFRGKDKDGNWVYGSLLQSEIAANGTVKCAIAERFADSYNIRIVEVDPESVGEYTGLKDKEGKEIYGGDLIERENIFSKFVLNVESFRCITLV